MTNKIAKYSYLNNIKIIEYLDNKKIVIKNKKRYDMEDVYKYLDDHNFFNYLKPQKITTDKLYFCYLPKINLDNDEIAKRLIYVLSILQNKTTIYKEIDKDKIKEEYDSYKEKINYLENYYLTLQDVVENKVYMAPSEYFFIRNVSIIYMALNYARNILEQWYKTIKTKKTERLVYCHGKLELSHFLANDDGYFISLEKAHLGGVWEDFLNFYHKNYQDTDMRSNFKFYQHKYQYKEEELLYLILNLVIPDKIDIYPSSLNKCSELVTFFDKLKLTSDFLLQNEKNNHHDKQNKFN